MTPEQFLDQLQRKGPQAAYLFLGSEGYNRDRCRRALGQDREVTEHDLNEVSLASALDDARALSLFASRRVLWLTRAETMAGDEPVGLAEYLREPTPDVVLVIDCSRFSFEGEEKARIEKVEKYYAAVPDKVEFRPFAPEASRALAQRLAKEAQLQLPLGELALLLEATGGDALRVAQEIEKLRLLVGTTRKVTADDIIALVPDAQAANIFALVAALGRGDRKRSLELLDTLAREGEYMPLALTFLATQFRMALVAREANLRGANAIQAHFNRLGARIWPERARQIEQTVESFPKERLEKAVAKVFEADRSLRDARPDDRIVMEEMILSLTS